MKNLTEGQHAIEFSLGSSTYDNRPQQRSVPDFKSFAEFILSTISDTKGRLFICASFSVGLHDDIEKYSGENSWRLKSHVQSRRFLSLDLDGIEPPEVWFWLRQWLSDEGLNHCWYTTSRHTAQKPRVRIILELSRLVTRDEGVALGKAFEAYLEACCPTKGAIKFDQSVYRGEMPCFLPVVNEQTKQNLGNETDTCHAIFDKEPLDVDHFQKHATPPPVTPKPKSITSAWKQKTITEQHELIGSFKNALRDWAETGSRHGFDSPTAQEKENTMREVGSVWNWCWQFNQESLAALIAELTKTPVTELGDNGRIKWLAVVTLGARFASVVSPDAQKIKSAMFDWSEEHPCYKDDYEGSVADFEQVWADGETTANITNTPIKTLLSLRKRKHPLPKLIMADDSVEDVLARPLDLSVAFDPYINQTCAQIEPNFTKLLQTLSKDVVTPHEEIDATSNSSTSDIDEPKQLPILTGSGDEIVELFNQKHFVTKEGASTFVFKETVDPELGHGALDKLTFPAFRGLYNQVASIGGKPRRIADFWLDSTARRTYVNGMAFIPNGNCPEHTYNLWRGFGVAPAPSAVGPILDYLIKVVCQNDATNYQYLVNWLASGIQHPERQGEVAVVLRGLKGVGKSTLGRLMLKIYGQHGMQITNSKHLVGNFNSHLRNTAFLFADEAFFAGDRIGENVLKGLVTEPHIVIEKKGIDAVVARNRLKILMCSNSEWVVPATSDERRFFILDVSDEQRGQVTYWQQLNNAVDNGGAAGFLHHLQQIDISKFNVRVVPNTSGLDSQKLQSLGVIESIMYNALYQGTLGFHEWTTESTLEVSSQALMDVVTTHCKDNFRFRFDTPNQAVVGKKIKQLVGAERRQTRTGLSRQWVYAIPNLHDARQSFCQQIGLLTDPWGDQLINKEAT